jgi:hypothetical protein
LFNGAESGRVITRNDKDYPKEYILLDGIHNIYKPIQDDILNYFTENHISFWHVPGVKKVYERPKRPKRPKRPTGHILSSQVCCLNHLFPIRHDKENVLRLAKAVCSDFIEVLPINTDNYSPGYIQFEAVSDIDYLNEISSKGKPTRGCICTSIDALIYAVHQNGSKYLIPIEWKYTEKYDNKDKSIEDSKAGKDKPKVTEGTGKKRLRRYSDLITNSRNLKSLPNYRNSLYFFEPFYQLMRQTLWAEQMVQHKDEERLKADDYIHIHIIPKENNGLLNKKYKISNKPLQESWLNNLKDQEKYRIISPLDFIRNIDTDKYSDLLNYLQERYWSNI